MAIVMTAKSRVRRALAIVNRFHLRYRWAFLLIVVAVTVIALFGAAELGKALFGLGLEQVLLHLGEWANSAEKAVSEA